MKKLFSFVIALLVIFTLSNKTSVSAKELDYIHNYEITIDVRKDGTLDMEFYLKWEVLDSSSEGPLSWIKVGIPNYYVDELEIISPNIRKLSYLSDGGSFVRIDLDKNYYRGQVLDIRFKTHQSRMYHLSGKAVYYDYSMGWFDNIRCRSATLRWNADGVYDSSVKNIEDGYYVYTSPLSYGETIHINLNYHQDYFDPLSRKLQYTDDYSTPFEKMMAIAIIVTLITVVVLVIYFAYNSTDPYYRYRGFCGRGYWHYYFFGGGRFYGGGVDRKGHRFVTPSYVNSGSSSGRVGGGCACACACACAGGGRAGCSRKDFYNIDKIIDKINKC